MEVSWAFSYDDHIDIDDDNLMSTKSYTSTTFQ